MNALPTANDTLVADLRQLIDGSRHRAAVAVNAELTLLYSQIGDRIHRNILDRQRAGYGEEIVSALGRRTDYGRGWSSRHRRLCIRFAQTYPDATIVHTLYAKLSWSHLKTLIDLDERQMQEFFSGLCRSCRLIAGGGQVGNAFRQFYQHIGWGWEQGALA